MNKKKNAQHIKAEDEIGSQVGALNSAIIGTFEGECADSNITNLNGLDITRDVWENVFSSDEYKRALDLGWYIGFLGHPQDVNCMDFEHACIVMTEGHISSNGKVYGKFNLIDTPVGRIVKAFIDAGVQFGISVRGAGDIINNSVDPSTFVFRGFDLVAFPAFPESVPTFTAIAAASDADSQAKYKSICAAVEANMDGLTTEESIDLVASQFAAQSEIRQKLEEHKATLSSKDTDTINNVDDDPELRDLVASQKLAGMTQLYLEAVASAQQLKDEVSSLRKQITASERKLRTLQRITSAQQSDLASGLDDVTASYDALKRVNNKLKSEHITLQNQNLKYKQTIDAAQSKSAEKDSVISKLRTELSETVTAASEANTRSSNLDAKNKDLSQRLKQADRLIQDYQDAYASLYANALGAELTNVKVTASTSVSELQQLIRGNTTVPKASIAASSEIDTDLDTIDIENDLVTL